VQVATGIAIDEFSGIIGYIGTGELCVGAGRHLISVGTPKTSEENGERRGVAGTHAAERCVKLCKDAFGLRHC
jgi:hypothetical protein